MILTHACIEYVYRYNSFVYIYICTLCNNCARIRSLCIEHWYVYFSVYISLVWINSRYLSCCKYFPTFEYSIRMCQGYFTSSILHFLRLLVGLEEWIQSKVKERKRKHILCKQYCGIFYYEYKTLKHYVNSHCGHKKLLDRRSSLSLHASRVVLFM